MFEKYTLDIGHLGLGVVPDYDVRRDVDDVFEATGKGKEQAALQDEVVGSA